MNGTTSMPQVQARVTGGCLQVALHELLSALNFVWIQTRQVSWTGLPLVEGRHVKSTNILARYPGRNRAYRPCMHGPWTSREGHASSSSCIAFKADCREAGAKRRRETVDVHEVLISKLEDFEENT